MLPRILQTYDLKHKDKGRKNWSFVDREWAEQTGFIDQVDPCIWTRKEIDFHK